MTTSEVLTTKPDAGAGGSSDPLLFTPYNVKSVTLKNRIVMSPMIMASCKSEDGMVTDFHLLHYGSRAMGQVGMVVLESSAVSRVGRINATDLGIWSDDHIPGLAKLVQLIHQYGAAAAVQINHAGRKNEFGDQILGPSPILFDEGRTTPTAMTHDEIRQVTDQFVQAAVRAKTAGFDVIEIHAAHGYLLSSFLSPLSNQRTDEYGGDVGGRYRFVHEVITAVKQVWDGPVFVRISATDYGEGGNTIEESLQFARRIKADGVDLVDCSTGGVVPGKLAIINPYPGYQVPFSDRIRNEVGVPTSAVGLIRGGEHAEEILRNNRADLIFVGRELLFDPYWSLRAASDLGHAIDVPRPYRRDRLGGRRRRT